MAETEAAPAVSTSEAVPEVVEAVPYDESLLIKDSKGKVKKPIKPDDSERNKQIEKLQEQITKHSDRIRDIKEVIESKRGSARSVGGGGRDIIKRLQDLRNQFQSVLRQKQHIRDELNDVTKGREDARAQLRAIRDKTNQTRIEDIEVKISELEERLRHDSTLTIQDEKKLHDQITKLNAAKPLAKEHVVVSQRLQETESIRTQIIDRLKECDAVLNGVKAKEAEEKAALDAIKSAESEETSDVPGLHVEKSECYQIIVSLRDKVTQIRTEYNEKYQEWVKLDKVYNAWSRHQKKLQWEDRRKEREEREVEKKTVIAANMPEPFESELLSCDQMTAYLKRLQGSQEEVVSTEAAVNLQAPAPGMMLLKKKGDDLLDTMFAGSGKKGKGAKKASNKDNKAPKKGKLVHDIDTLKAFMLLKVGVPQTTDEVAKTLEAVAASKADFLKQREERKNAPPPAKKAAQNGTAEPTVEAAADEAPEAAENGAAEAAAEDVAEAGVAADSAAEGADDGAAAAEEVAPEAAAKEVAAETAKDLPAAAAAAPPAPAAEAAPVAEAAAEVEAEEAQSHHVSDVEAEESDQTEVKAANGDASVVDKLARDVSVTLSVTDDTDEICVSVKVSDDAEA